MRVCRLGRLTAIVDAALAIVLTVAVSRAAYAQTEQVEYYALDAIGSVRVVFDASGLVLGRMDYAPFGEELYTGLFMPSERYAHLTRDGEAGLDYAQARMYQTRTGRLNAPDPVYSGLFAPQAWNKYTYALNQPLVLTDPTGLNPVSPAGMSLYNELFNPNHSTTVTASVGGHGSSSGSSFGAMLSGGGAMFVVEQHEMLDTGASTTGIGWADTIQNALDLTSIGLDATGVGGVVSAVPDVINAGVSFVRGDTSGAGLSVAAAFPFLGSAANAVRLQRSLQYGAHTLERMTKRGITEAMIKKVIEKGEILYDPLRDSRIHVLRGGMASGQDIIVAVNPYTGFVKTTIAGSNVVRSRFVPYPRD